MLGFIKRFYGSSSFYVREDPSPSAMPVFQQFGGNTTCLQITFTDTSCILPSFDARSGTAESG
jgi:hypothetical protein